MEIKDEWLKQGVLMLVAGAVGAGGGFGTSSLRENEHAAAYRDIEQELSELKTELAVLNVKLQFITTGEVDFMTGIAPVAPFPLSSPPSAADDVEPRG